MKQGFTLLELSIVMVIIGLIIGGITVGQDLIRAAELKKIVTDSNKYKLAINTFKLKYNALPGDLKNAGSYWPSCDATPANCNGDGDGIVDNLWSPNDDNLEESWRFWQQLSDTELISGTYSGEDDTSCSSSSRCVIEDVNVPSGVDEASVWSFFIVRSGTNSGNGRTRNTLVYSAPHPSTGRWYGPILTPEDAVNIDRKIDDGMPYIGKISGWSGGGYITNCTTPGNSAATDEYNLTDSETRCLLYFDYD